MDVRRKRWFGALALFLAWVATLAAMAVVSGRRPTEHHRAPAPR